MLYEKFEKLEKLLEGEEYFEGGVTYCLSFHKLNSTLSLNDSLIEQLIELEVIDLINTNGEINVISVQQPKMELKKLCDEWHIHKKISDKILELINDEIKMYKFCEDYVYVSSGVVSEIYRIIETEEERILIDFYITD